MKKRRLLPGPTLVLLLAGIVQFGSRDATANHRLVEIYDDFGVQQGDSIEVVLFAQLHSLKNGFAVIDGNGGVNRRVRIYDNFGEQQNEDIQTDGQAGVISKDNVIAVIDDAEVQFYTLFGVPLGTSILTDGRASVFPISESIFVITDSQRARLFNNLGGQIGATIDTNLRPAIKPVVALGNTRIAVADFGRVRLYDLLGNLVGNPITTTANKTASLTVSKNGVFVVNDDDSVRFFNLLGTQLGDAVATNLPRATIVPVVDRIVVVDNNRARIYRENDGGSIREISTFGLATVVANVTRIIVIDDNKQRLRIHDLSGELTDTLVANSAADVVVTVHNRFVVVEDNRVRILDPFGSPVNDIPAIGRADIAHATDKIFITDDNQVRTFDHFGTPRGQTFDTDERAKLIANVSAIGFDADDRFRIYNHVNETLGGTIATQGTVSLAASNDRIAISYTHLDGDDEPITGLQLSHDGPTMLGRPTTFNATISKGTNVSFVWAFGDGTFLEGATVTHTYQATGSFEVVLTATNSVSDVTRQTSVDIIAAENSVNLKVNGLDSEFPSAISSTGPVRLTLDMGAGPDVLDHYYAIAVGGTVYWVTPGGLTTTVAPLGSFAPVDLTDLVLLDSTLPPGDWVFGWFMLDGATVVDFDLILANVAVPTSDVQR